MKLTRRDAISALAAAGVAVGAGSAVLRSVGDDQREPDSADSARPITGNQLSTLVATAEILYPSDVEHIDEFVTRYIRGRAEDDPEHGEGIANAATYLNEYARAWHDEEFRDLLPAVREEALRRMNADIVEPVPDGSDVERVRYYVVNELLFALYTTPTGGELVGIENPQGHPGGLASYQRGPHP